MRKPRTNLIKSSFSGLTGILEKTIFILPFFPFLLVSPGALSAPMSCVLAPVFLLLICSILPLHMSYLPPSRHFLIVKLFPVGGCDPTQRFEIPPGVRLRYKRGLSEIGSSVNKCLSRGLTPTVGRKCFLGVCFCLPPKTHTYTHTRPLTPLEVRHVGQVMF